MKFWKRTGTILLGLAPMPAAMLIQYLLIIPFLGLSSAYAFMRTRGNGYASMDYAYDIWSGNLFNAWFSVAFSLCIILLFGYWYSCSFEPFSLKPAAIRRFSNPGMIFGVLILSIGLQYVVNYVFNITAAINSEWLDAFLDLDMGTQNFGLILYAIILAPINEELLFRGVTFGYLKKAMPFWLANLIQALLFGIYHMNVMQAVYAFVIGLFLGYVCQKGGSIFYSILLHIIYNFFTSYASPLLFFGNNPLFHIIWIADAIVIPILGLYLFRISLRQKKG